MRRCNSEPMGEAGVDKFLAVVLVGGKAFATHPLDGEEKLHSYKHERRVGKRCKF